MAVRKIKGSWWADFQINHTRYRKRSPLNTKAGAEAFEVQMRQALSEKGSLDHLLAPTTNTKIVQTFAEFSRRWLTTYVAINNKPSEQRGKRRILHAALIPSFGVMALNEIKTTDIESYKAKELKRGISAKTINNRLAVLRKCLVTAIEWEELERLPKIKLLKTTPPKFRFLREAELQAILAACATPDDRAIVLVGARTGLRFSELRALEWGDIDFAHRLLTVRRCAVINDIGTPKNGRIRHVPLTNEVIDVLQAIKQSKGLIFPFQGRMRVHWTSLVHLQQTCTRAGIEPIGWHTLRHTFASHLVSKGASIKAVQDLLGHSTINMTQRYAHLAPETLHDTVALLEPQKNSMSAQCQPEVKKNSVEMEKLLSNLFNSSLCIEKT